jgi:pyruvate/2-oxoglutarate dehydrogenase complex dihydrolipoamide dehydrogenase (E3) component
MDRYDVVIIGAGQAGVPLAFDLAEAGKKTALIERKHLGGSCVNFGCTPTKAAITSARLAHLARRASEFGLRIPAVEVDFAAVIARARGIVDSQRSSLERAFEGKRNLTLIRAQGRLEGREGDRFRIRAGDQILLADQVVLDTGTRSVIPPIEGIDAVPVLHAGNWLDLSALPARLIIIGGGVIALEMAQFYRRMGSAVSVIETQSRIAHTEDADVADALQDLLEGEGIEFHLDSNIERVEARGSAVCVEVKGKGEIAGSHLFVATGRKPNTDDLGLESVGVAVDGGIVRVDERLATNIRGVWAAGDIRGGPMFTHTAWDDYRVLYSQIAGDRSRTTRRIVPYAIFTDPEVGRVGMTESEARKQGKDVRVARYELRRNAKALEEGETEGFIKVVADATTGQLLGAALLCHDAAELVHIYIDLMNTGAPYRVIRDAVFIHPTLAEAVQSAVSALG